MSLIDARTQQSRTVLATLLLLLIPRARVFVVRNIRKEAETRQHSDHSMFDDHDEFRPRNSERLLIRPMESRNASIEAQKSPTLYKCLRNRRPVQSGHA